MKNTHIGIGKEQPPQQFSNTVNETKLLLNLSQFKMLLKMMLVIMVVGFMSFLALYYYSTKEQAERMYQETEEAFLHAHEVACEYGIYSDKHNVGDPDMMEHCQYLKEDNVLVQSEGERILAWGSEFHDKFIN